VLVVEGRDEQFLALPASLAELDQQVGNIDSYDNRVSALTCASSQILNYLNVWPKIERLRSKAYQDMNVWDGQGSGKIEFSSKQLYENNLGHIVENNVVLAALLETAVECGLNILCDAKVSELSEFDQQTGLRQLKCQVTAQTLANSDCAQRFVRNSELTEEYNTINIKAPLIIGADGAMSKVRQLSAIPLWQWDYGHHAIVATVETQYPNKSTAWQRFTEDGPLAFLPLANPHFSSIVWSTSPGHAKHLMELDDLQFQIRLSQAFEHKLGDVVNVSKRAKFPLRQRHAKFYVQQGLALIGDAVHTIHPLAGQGVNLGLLDAAALVQVLTHAKQRKQDISQLALLKKFQRMRHAENIKMSAAMQGFKWLFDERSAPLIIARNFGMSLLNNSAAVKQHIIMQAMGLSGNLPDLAKRPVS
jgi:2-octaprenylphenol hydroxylase